MTLHYKNYNIQANDLVYNKIKNYITNASNLQQFQKEKTIFLFPKTTFLNQQKIYQRLLLHEDHFITLSCQYR